MDDGDESEIHTINYKILISLVSAKWGPKLTIALQSITIRKGGSGPHNDSTSSSSLNVSGQSTLDHVNKLILGNLNVNGTTIIIDTVINNHDTSMNSLSVSTT